ncbi:MAG: complex I NDUFA9 subunit family protein [Paracoccaceae bacterium]
MSGNAPLVTIFGGSGFLGRHIARRMAKAGWRVRVAVRRPNEALFVRPYGTPGQVEPVLANIRDDASVAAALRGADAVVNCVGILAQTSRQRFETVHAEGARRIASLAAAAGITNFVHVSALGADAESNSVNARSKAEGEAYVLETQPGATILRPSVMFGKDDTFFNRFATLTRFMPVMFLPGLNTRFQPVYVDDVAAAAEAALRDGHAGVFELGGPVAETLRETLGRMLRITRRRRLLLNMPDWLGRFFGGVIEFSHWLTLGIVPKLLTRDQVRQLRYDNVVAPDALGFAELGITPTPMDLILPEYLWRFRPDGQFEALTESARNLR